LKYAQELFGGLLGVLGGLLASFAVPARMKKPLDFDVASNPHNALLETEEPAHDHPSQLSSSFPWRRFSWPRSESCGYRIVAIASISYNVPFMQLDTGRII
jgi:hypothetical protein